MKKADPSAPGRDTKAVTDPSNPIGSGFRTATGEERRAFVDNYERRILKDKIRLNACHRDNRESGHSGVWCAWSHRNDYYLGARSILGSMKISLHASGICRVAL